MKKSLKFCHLISRICFFKGLCLLFFSNVPGAMFIQGAMLIPETRVYKPTTVLYTYCIVANSNMFCVVPQCP